MASGGREPDASSSQSQSPVRSDGADNRYHQHHPAAFAHGTPFDQHHDHHPHQHQNAPHHQHQPAKVVRLRKACDPCSLRKVRCDQNHPCTPCKQLDLPCTFERPSRRRGPPNRLAQALKREHESRHASPISSPSARIASTFPTSNPLTAESIAPLNLVTLLVNDYFNHLHPLQPFPHEPSFRRAFEQRRDLHDRSFLALLASMIGASVAAYPRKARQSLKSLGDQNLFPTAVEFVIHCGNVATNARGNAYLERSGLSSSDAATSYCLTIMFAYTYRWQSGSLYFGECYNIIRCLLSQRASREQVAQDPELAADGSVDLIESEMTLRLFWTCFVSVRSVTACGVSLGDVCINPPTASHHYVPLPREVDDIRIHPTYIEQQPAQSPSRLIGFIANVRIYLSHDPLVAMENSFGVDHVFDVERQKATLFACDQTAKKVMSRLPDQLSIWSGPPSRSPSANTHSKLGGQSEGLDSSPTAAGHASEPLDNLDHTHDMAFQIQKANLYASYLSTRSYFVEKYYNVCENVHGSDGSGPVAFGQSVSDARCWVRTERESIAADLLHVLSAICPIHFEPNGASLTLKIRQVASTLLPDTTPGSSPVSEGISLSPDGSSVYYLRQFMELLIDLERGSKSDDSGTDTENDEELDLKRWANMREHQRAFAKSGGSTIM